MYGIKNLIDSNAWLTILWALGLPAHTWIVKQPSEECRRWHVLVEWVVVHWSMAFCLSWEFFLLEKEKSAKEEDCKDRTDRNPVLILFHLVELWKAQAHYVGCPHVVFLQCSELQQVSRPSEPQASQVCQPE